MKRRVVDKNYERWKENPSERSKCHYRAVSRLTLLLPVVISIPKEKTGAGAIMMFWWAGAIMCQLLIRLQ